MDKYHRSIAKAVSYRLVAVIATTVIALLVTGEARSAATIGFVDGLFKFGLYYVHERSWNRVGFGRARTPEYQI